MLSLSVELCVQRARELSLLAAIASLLAAIVCSAVGWVQSVAQFQDGRRCPWHQGQVRLELIPGLAARPALEGI
jgi:hypothetical protein